MKKVRVIQNVKPVVPPYPGDPYYLTHVQQPCLPEKPVHGEHELYSRYVFYSKAWGLLSPHVYFRSSHQPKPCARGRCLLGQSTASHVDFMMCALAQKCCWITHQDGPTSMKKMVVYKEELDGALLKRCTACIFSASTSNPRVLWFILLTVRLFWIMADEHRSFTW